MKFYIFLLSMFFFLSGCNAFQQAPIARLPSSNTTVIPPSDPAENTEPKTRFGIVKCNAADQQRFLKSLGDFFSSVQSPSTLAPVNCADDHNTKGGVFMEGQVHFAGNRVFYPGATSQQLQISNGSLTIFIRDTVGKQTKFDYRINPHTSFVQGQSIDLTFEENQGIGTVTLSGQSQNKKFTGVLSFSNRIRFDRQAVGAQGSLGWFTFETCAILKCR